MRATTSVLRSDARQAAGGCADEPGFAHAYGVTLVATQIVAALGFVAYRVALSLFSQQGFFEYSLARRALGVVAPLLLLGVSLSLTRDVARTRASTTGAPPRQLLAAGLLPCSALALAGIVLALAMPAPLALLLFGTESLRTLVFPVAVYAAGLSAVHLWISYWKGAQRFGVAAVLNLLGLGVVPFGCLFAVGPGVPRVLLLTGSALLLMTAVGVVPLLRGNGAKERLLVPSLLRRHLSYGASRMPGNVAFFALLLLPSWWATRHVGLADGGVTAFAVSMLNLSGVLVTPIAFVMLPRAVAFERQGRRVELRALVARQVAVVAALALVAVLFAWAFAGRFFAWWLGPEVDAANDALGWALPGLLPYAVFLCLQGTIDALSRRPINTLNAVVALSVALAISLLLTPSVGAGKAAFVGFLGGLSILALFSMFAAYALLRDRTGTTEPRSEQRRGPILERT